MTGLAITISLGIAAARAEETVSGLIERADAALYQAKRAGRNRVVAEAASAGPQRQAG